MVWPDSVHRPDLRKRTRSGTWTSATAGQGPGAVWASRGPGPLGTLSNNLEDDVPRRRRRPEARARVTARAGAHRLSRSGGGQRLASAERHHPVAAPGDLSAPETHICLELRPDWSDDAGADDDRVGSATGGWPLYRSAADAVRARRRHGLLPRRIAAAVDGVDIRHAAGGGGTGRSRLVGLSPGIVANRADGLRRTPRHGAIVVSGRRQHGLVARPAAGGVSRGAVRPGEHRVVLPAGRRWRGAHGEDRPMVPDPAVARLARCGQGDAGPDHPRSPPAASAGRSRSSRR